MNWLLCTAKLDPCSCLEFRFSNHGMAENPKLNGTYIIMFPSQGPWHLVFVVVDIFTENST